MYDILELNQKLLPDLRVIAKELKIKRVESFKKQDLIYKILDTQAIVVSETKVAKKEEAKKDGPRKPGRKPKSREEAPKTTEASEVSETPKRKPGRPKKEKKEEETPCSWVYGQAFWARPF